MFLGFKYMPLFACVLECFNIIIFWFTMPLFWYMANIDHHHTFVCVFWCFCFLMMNHSLGVWCTKVPNTNFLFSLLCKFVFVGLNIFPSWCTNLPITNRFFFVRLSDLTTLLPISCLLFEMLKYTHYQTQLCEH
jgi:hypothetical protein